MAASNCSGFLSMTFAEVDAFVMSVKGDICADGIKPGEVASALASHEAVIERRQYGFAVVQVSDQFTGAINMISGKATGPYLWLLYVTSKSGAISAAFRRGRFSGTSRSGVRSGTEATLSGSSSGAPEAARGRSHDPSNAKNPAARLPDAPGGCRPGFPRPGRYRLSAPAGKLWRRPLVQKKTGLSKTGLYSRIKDGGFPAPISLDGGRLAVWDSIEVQRWIDDQATRFRGKRAEQSQGVQS